MPQARGKLEGNSVYSLLFHPNEAVFPTLRFQTVYPRSISNKSAVSTWANYVRSEPGVNFGGKPKELVPEPICPGGFRDAALLRGRPDRLDGLGCRLVDC
jgi:hypothetical protein